MQLSLGPESAASGSYELINIQCNFSALVRLLLTSYVLRAESLLFRALAFSMP